MFVDTSSTESTEISLCNILKISIEELYFALENIDTPCWNGIYFDSERFAQNSRQYIDSHTAQIPDEIMFYHLGRRLNAAEEDIKGKNLKELLLTDNSFSSFLQAHEFAFSFDNEIEIFYRGKNIPLPEKSNDYAVNYLRRRLGYEMQYKDYCFNGFAFRERLLRNNYSSVLRNAPEFILGLSNLVKNPKLAADYKQNSKFYCFTYKLPIEQVLFDDYEKISDMEKAYYLLTECFRRLIDRKKNPYFTSDEDNPRLRLYDDSCMESRWFVKKEEL